MYGSCSVSCDVFHTHKSKTWSRSLTRRNPFLFVVYYMPPAVQFGVKFLIQKKKSNRARSPTTRLGSEQKIASMRLLDVEKKGRKIESRSAGCRAKNKRFRVRAVSRTRDGKEMFGLDGHALLTAHPSHREPDNCSTHTAVKTSFFFLYNTHATSIFLFLWRRTVYSIYRSRKKKKGTFVGRGMLSVPSNCFGRLLYSSPAFFPAHPWAGSIEGDKRAKTS